MARSKTAVSIRPLETLDISAILTALLRRISSIDLDGSEELASSCVMVTNVAHSVINSSWSINPWNASLWERKWNCYCDVYFDFYSSWKLSFSRTVLARKGGAFWGSLSRVVPILKFCRYVKVKRAMPSKRNDKLDKLDRFLPVSTHCYSKAWRGVKTY